MKKGEPLYNALDTIRWVAFIDSRDYEDFGATGEMKNEMVTIDANDVEALRKATTIKKAYNICLQMRYLREGLNDAMCFVEKHLGW